MLNLGQPDSHHGTGLGANGPVDCLDAGAIAMTGPTAVCHTTACTPYFAMQVSLSATW